jgi:cephalosporin hydroxylase
MLGRRRNVVNDFHKLYYGSPDRTWKSTFWRGVEVQKCPLDLWVYQEILNELQPDLIVETGTLHGGSAYYLAGICDLIGKGRVVTIDLQALPGRPVHPRLTYKLASSVDPATLEEVRTLAGAGVVLVILDSDHSRDHVLAELRAYAPLVTPGSYLVVEDTNLNAHPVYPEFGPGPMEAVDLFLRENRDFAVDAEREKFFMTFNPRGFLRKR